jgi:hypothetical protein
VCPILGREDLLDILGVRRRHVDQALRVLRRQLLISQIGVKVPPRPLPELVRTADPSTHTGLILVGKLNDIAILFFVHLI